MTPEETRALSRRVAEALDTDEAWLPAEKCPQGHENDDPEGGSLHEIGEPCFWCAYEAAKAAHPGGGMEGSRKRIDMITDLEREPKSEWCIPRGEPKPYATSLDLLVPVVEGWCERRHGYWRLSGGAAEIGLLTEEGEQGLFTGVAGCKTREALARAYLAAIERWGR